MKSRKHTPARVVAYRFRSAVRLYLGSAKEVTPGARRMRPAAKSALLGAAYGGNSRLYERGSRVTVKGTMIIECDLDLYEAFFAGLQR